jgi:hypothetical protein
MNDKTIGIASIIALVGGVSLLKGKKSVKNAEIFEAKGKQAVGMIRNNAKILSSTYDESYGYYHKLYVNQGNVGFRKKFKSKMNLTNEEYDFAFMQNGYFGSQGMIIQNLTGVPNFFSFQNTTILGAIRMVGDIGRYFGENDRYIRTFLGQKNKMILYKDWVDMNDKQRSKITSNLYSDGDFSASKIGKQFALAQNQTGQAEPKRFMDKYYYLLNQLMNLYCWGKVNPEIKAYVYKTSKLLRTTPQNIRWFNSLDNAQSFYQKQKGNWNVGEIDDAEKVKKFIDGMIDALPKSYWLMKGSEIKFAYAKAQADEALANRQEIIVIEMQMKNDTLKESIKEDFRNQVSPQWKGKSLSRFNDKIKGLEAYIEECRNEVIQELFDEHNARMNVLESL